MTIIAPEYPIRVFFKETNETWILHTPKEIAENLEWFDSEDPDENATVVDKRGKNVILKVEMLEIKVCQII